MTETDLPTTLGEPPRVSGEMYLGVSDERPSFWRRLRIQSRIIAWVAITDPRHEKYSVGAAAVAIIGVALVAELAASAVISVFISVVDGTSHDTNALRHHDVTIQHTIDLRVEFTDLPPQASPHRLPDGRDWRLIHQLVHGPNCV